MEHLIEAIVRKIISNRNLYHKNNCIWIISTIFNKLLRRCIWTTLNYKKIQEYRFFQCTHARTLPLIEYPFKTIVRRTYPTQCSILWQDTQSRVISTNFDKLLRARGSKIPNSKKTRKNRFLPKYRGGMAPIDAAIPRIHITFAETSSNLFKEPLTRRLPYEARNRES